jgi:acyl phosphate:glycerol-3-phosphate acyltransferase
LITALCCVALAYVLGSISSTCIVGYLLGRMDMRTEPDGKISAAAIFRRLGLGPFVCVGLMDIGLVALAVIIAKLLTNSPTIMMFAGIAAVAGHNWSIFLGLRGGLGATAIFGALVAVMPLQAWYGVIGGGIIWVLTSRPSLGTVVGIGIISGTSVLQMGMGTLAMYPLMLFFLMLLKQFQVARVARTAH